MHRPVSKADQTTAEHMLRAAITHVRLNAEPKPVSAPKLVCVPGQPVQLMRG